MDWSGPVVDQMALNLEKVALSVDYTKGSLNFSAAFWRQDFNPAPSAERFLKTTILGAEFV